MSPTKDGQRAVYGVHYDDAVSPAVRAACSAAALSARAFWTKAVSHGLSTGDSVCRPGCRPESRSTSTGVSVAPSTRVSVHADWSLSRSVDRSLGLRRPESQSLRRPESRSASTGVSVAPSTGVSVRRHGLPPRTPTSAADCASPRIPKKGLTTELMHSPETRSNRFLTERSSEIDCHTCMHALSRTCSSQTSRAYLARGDDTMTRHNLEY
jgi:cell division septation protein DedD